MLKKGLVRHLAASIQCRTVQGPSIGRRKECCHVSSELETVEIKKGQLDIVEKKKGSTHFFFFLKRNLNNILKTCLIRWKQIGLKYFYKGGGIGHEKMYRIPGPPPYNLFLYIYAKGFYNG
jgi:hypothetical protein